VLFSDRENVDEVEWVMTGDGSGVMCDVFCRNRELIKKSGCKEVGEHCDTLHIMGDFCARSVARFVSCR